MTYEETKKMLKSLYSKKRLLRSLERQIAEERRSISVTAVDYSKDHVKGGVPTSQQQRYMEHIERLQDRFEKLLDEMFAIEDMLAEHLGDLTETEQTIVVERYMHGKSWKSLEKELNYSLDGILRINREVINIIRE